MVSDVAPGWYADPSGRHEHRYWDGTAWTQRVRSRGVEGMDTAPHEGLTSGLTSGLPGLSRSRASAQHSETAYSADRRRRRRRVAVLVSSLAVITVAVIALIVTAVVTMSDQTPVVGECAHLEEGELLTKVDCHDADADFVVTSRSTDDVDPEKFCADDPDSTTYFAYSTPPLSVDADQLVLCLRETEIHDT